MSPAITITGIRKAVWHHEALPCQQTSYRPDHVVQPPNSDLPYPELLYTMGDRFDPSYYPPGDPRNDGTDKLHLSGRHAAGEWEPVVQEDGTNIIAAPWKMFHIPPAALRLNPEMIVGSMASPSVLNIGDGQVMFFVGTVADPNGLARKQFTLFSAASLNFQNWRPQNWRRNHPNKTIQRALAWFGDFSPIDFGVGSESGITGVSALYDSPYIYLAIGVWPKQGNGILRLRMVGEATGRLEIWKGWRSFPTEPIWEEVVNGELPRWFTSEWAAGNPRQGMSQIMRNPFGLTKDRPGRGRRYACVSVNDQGLIEFAFSDDLLDWPTDEAIAIAWPTPIANVRDPHYGGGKLYFATNDGGVLKGQAPTGVMGCGDPYHGLCIAEADLEVS